LQVISVPSGANLPCKSRPDLPTRRGKMFGAEGHSLLSGSVSRQDYGQERKRDVPHALFHAGHVIRAVCEDFIICKSLACEPGEGSCAYTAAYPY
jgi:hypothetical protein